MSKLHTNSQKGNAVVWFLLAAAFAAWLFIGGDDSEVTGTGINSDRLEANVYESSKKTIESSEAIYEFWDEIKEYVNGSETIDACSDESGNCYSLDADISDGRVETIYFPNEGYLYLSADIDEDGNASDFDSNGNGWSFSVDMDSSIIDDAIYDWASDNDYMIK